MPDSSEPEALITILLGGCDIRPALYPIATEAAP